VHTTTNPAILYFGTPVVLISTVNEDDSFNLAPMSSAWWLGWRCLLGLGARSKTPQNMARTGECVLNLPSSDQVAAVDRLARTTGSDPVPAPKRRRGYRHVKDKFGHAGLTPVVADTVAAPRVAECPVQLEATVSAFHAVGDDDPDARGALVAIEVAIQRVHVEESLLVPGEPDRIDPDRWRPLIMSFQRFYGVADGEVHGSELAKIPEALYR
jgi:flavin reductase (DIM6/NTAB) family NADH-FMN oxidoreductase RutF